MFGLGAPKRRKRKSSKKRKRKSTARRRGGMSASKYKEALGLGYAMGKGGLGRKRRRGGAKAKRRGRKRRQKLGQNRVSYKRMYGMGAVSPAARRALRAEPFIGAYRWLGTQDGMMAAGGVVAGASIGLATTRAFQSFIWAPKDAAGVTTAAAVQTDPMSNILGDLLGAGVAWEVGKMVNPQFALYAAAAAATRTIAGMAASTLINPLIKNFEYGTAKIKLPETQGAADGLGAWHEYEFEGGGVGQVRVPDDAALGYIGQEYYGESDELYGLGADEMTLF
jgi:hypothetical protein